MLIHDPVTIARLHQEAGGRCGIFSHPIPLDNSFLEQNEKYTKVVGWLAGITYLQEIITEATKQEFRDVFQVVKVQEEKVPKIGFAYQEMTEKDSAFLKKHLNGWLTLLTWTCWHCAGDPTQEATERAYWWGILNKLCNEVFSWKPTRTDEKARRFVLPAGLMSHPCRVSNKESKAGWHQLNHLAPNGLTDADYVAPRAIQKVREFVRDVDVTIFLFDQKHRTRIQAMPLDPTVAPFLLNTVNPQAWSVVSAMQQCDKEQSDQVAQDILFSSVFERVNETLRVHQVDPEEARTNALEIAMAALVATTGKGIPDQAIRELLVQFDNHDFEVDRASNWIEPLAQGAGF